MAFTVPTAYIRFARYCGKISTSLVQPPSLFSGTVNSLPTANDKHSLRKNVKFWSKLLKFVNTVFIAVLFFWLQLKFLERAYLPAQVPVLNQECFQHNNQLSVIIENYALLYKLQIGTS